MRKIGTQTMAWTIDGDDESNTVDWQGLTISDTRKQVFAALQVDVLAGAPPQPPAPQGDFAGTASRLIINESDQATLVMSWFADASRSYQLQWTASREPGKVNWHNTGLPVDGDDSVHVITNEIPGVRQRFYRLLSTQL